MNAPLLAPRQPDARLEGIIKLAILAVGGQGGGVLTNWIEDLARANGYAAQATSVAGVAQRTGATVYYIEMAPTHGGVPIFSLMPAAGDVDIMITAELMEAGRSVMRGFVTPDRTVLITSTHRALAVSEKMVPGNGISSSEEVIAAAEIAARHLIAADFDQIAIQNGSVISASMFGALAGSGALPFPREAFEAAIRKGGKGVEPSLRAFAAGFEQAASGAAAQLPAKPKPAAKGTGVQGPAALTAKWQKLLAEVQALPAPVVEMATAGLEKVVDFQDLAYGEEYLARLKTVLAQDEAAKDWVLSREAAKYIANALCYDDIIRVADRKTRASRFERIKGEMGLKDGKLMQLTEYFHPQAAEISGMMPAKMGARWQNDPKRMARLTRWFDKGRRLRSDSLGAFVMLYVLGGLKGWRRKTLRHQQEQQHLQQWLDKALAIRAGNYDLGVEVLRCRRLVKGYSDTHSRGLSKFDRVLAGIDLITQRSDAADWARRLREAALQDEEGTSLDGAIATIKSFA